MAELWRNTEEIDPFAAIDKSTTESINMDGMTIDATESSGQSADAMLASHIAESEFPTETGGMFDEPSYPFAPRLQAARRVRRALDASPRADTPSPGPSGPPPQVEPPDGAQAPHHKFLTAPNILGVLLSGVGAALAGIPIAAAAGLTLAAGAGEAQGMQTANTAADQQLMIERAKATGKGRGSSKLPINPMHITQTLLTAAMGDENNWSNVKKGFDDLAAQSDEYAYISAFTSGSYQSMRRQALAKSGSTKMIMDAAKMYLDTGDYNHAQALLMATFNAVTGEDVPPDKQGEFLIMKSLYEGVPDDFIGFMWERKLDVAEQRNILEGLQMLTIAHNGDRTAANAVIAELIDSIPGREEETFSTAYYTRMGSLAAETTEQGLKIPDVVAEVDKSLNSDPVVRAQLESFLLRYSGNPVAQAQMRAKYRMDRLSERIQSMGLSVPDYISLNYWNVQAKLPTTKDDFTAKMGEWKNYLTAALRGYGMAEPAWDETQWINAYKLGWEAFAARKKDAASQASTTTTTTTTSTSGTRR